MGILSGQTSGFIQKCCSRWGFFFITDLVWGYLSDHYPRMGILILMTFKILPCAYIQPPLPPYPTWEQNEVYNWCLLSQNIWLSCVVVILQYSLWQNILACGCVRRWEGWFPSYLILPHIPSLSPALTLTGYLKHMVT